jgi:hypothetical protein
MPELPTTTATFEFDSPDRALKLEELIAYIALRCENDPAFGKTKLAKILHFSDFTHYARFGRPITGVAYYKFPQGPLPKDMYSTVEASSKLAFVEREHFGRPQQRVITLRDPDLSLFSGTEIAVVDEMIDRFDLLSARDVSEVSHGIAWEVTVSRQPIAYELSLVESQPARGFDLRLAAELLAAEQVPA